jgi:hypothetical protein
VSVNEFVLVQGLRDTRGALGRWNARPGPVLRDWFVAALAVAVALLLSVWAVASLPRAAWTIASRRDEWHDLLAATFATVAIAVPMLVAAATWEIYVWPRLWRGRRRSFRTSSSRSQHTCGSR